MKSLTEEDVNFLNEYNFMFEEEYNKYNIKIDGKFIIRQITKWKNAFDEDKAIKQTFLFIDKLYKINKEELDDLINDLIECLDINIDELLDEIENGNVKYICDLLRQYYELNNDIKKLKK